MRILQLHNRHRIAGGEDAAVLAERELLEHNGHLVSSYVIDNPTPPLATAKAFVRAPWNSSAARDVAQAAKAFGPDIAHVHNTWFALSPAVIRQLHTLGIPVVVTLHNFRTSCINGLLLRDGEPCQLCVGRGPLPGVRHRCYRNSLGLSMVAAATVKSADRHGVWRRDVAEFIALDEGAVEVLSRGGIPMHEITVRPNFSGDPGRREAAPSASKVILYVGRLSHEKGADVLIDAWRAADLEHFSLTVFGDGPLKSELEARAPAGVRFAGRVDRRTIEAAMLRARALVFPSICREAGPLAPIEAAAAGLPVIISSQVGMATRLRDAGAGWPVPPGDAPRLSAALQVLRQPAVVDRVGKAARALYESTYTAEQALRSLESIYENAVLHAHNMQVN
jgi:glycosyltransferase involved in cell wall biosynthesis